MSDQNSLPDLRGEVEAPASLRARVEQDLYRRGLLRRPWAVWRTAIRLAAAVALFASGMWAGAGVNWKGAGAPAVSPGEAQAPPAREFALLLYEPASFDTSQPHAVLAREYEAWAVGLQTRFVSGEALGAQRIVGGREADVGSAVPTGYFIVRAERWEDAMAIAEDCPHLRYGGVVAVREVL